MIPSSTYRIQFRNGMTFDRVVDLIPYMKDLGISHLYASPVFTATTDSTHGYDVTDPNEIDPAIGGREGFDRMAAALKQAGMGLILDIVPNHMSTSLENRWWRDVIEQGRQSRYAAYFDIDWSRPLTLPFLGDTSEPALSLIVRILTGDLPEDDHALASLFRTRFQQLTGPLMAKSVEDTLFFRHNLELALNEVGADPTPRAFSLSRFHQEMRIRLARQPDALLGTSTHDTKRGEDARARLYTLTEAPDLWGENLARWRQMNQTQVRFLNDGTAPNAADTWMIFQALAGVWPATLSPDDRDGLKSLEERFLGFIEKALREAKQRTDWIDSNEGYESVVLDYVRHLLSPDNTLFLRDFSAALQPFIRAGLMNSLSQTVIKLTAPGVPDIYQGSEGLNFSLVDPDNRREPDFTALAENLSVADGTIFNDAQRWREGSVKQYVTATLLRLRPHYPALFRYGDWLPLKVTGEREENLIVYARIKDDEALIVAVPRLVFDVTDNAMLWANTTVAIPQELAGKHYRDLFTGERRLLPETLDLTSEKGCLLVLLTCD